MTHSFLLNISIYVIWTERNVQLHRFTFWSIDSIISRIECQIIDHIWRFKDSNPTTLSRLMTLASNCESSIWMTNPFIAKYTISIRLKLQTSKSNLDLFNILHLQKKKEINYFRPDYVKLTSSLEVKKFIRLQPENLDLMACIILHFYALNMKAIYEKTGLWKILPLI